MDLNMTSDLSDHVKVWLQTPQRLLALKPEQRQDRPGPRQKLATTQGPMLLQQPAAGQRPVTGPRPAPVQGLGQ